MKEINKKEFDGNSTRLHPFFFAHAQFFKETRKKTAASGGRCQI
jgi:hypothetical protein